MDTKQLRVSELANTPFTRAAKVARTNRVIRFFPAVRPSRVCRQTIASLQREARMAVLEASVVRPNAADKAERIMLCLLSGMAAIAIVVTTLGVGTGSQGMEDFVRFVGGLL